MDRTILHSDMNAFYASVECFVQPKLRGKPVAVAGDPEQRHGIILTKNQEAKKFQISAGMAIWEARRRCPDLIVVPPNYPLYQKFSRLAREIYLDYTDLVEPFGLDECWLDVTGSVGLLGTGGRIAEEIRQRVKFELGITVSIGVSWNKIFAKLGSDYKKPDAMISIQKDNYQAIAWPLPASDLLWVGPATKKRLDSYRVRTIGELAQTSPELLRSWFGKIGDVLYSFANGYDAAPVAKFDNQPTVKSIGNSTTTPRDLENLEDVKLTLLVLADSVARRMREQGFKGRVVSVSIRDTQLFSITRQKALKKHTNITNEITAAAMDLVRKYYQWYRPVRSIGVSVSDLAPDSICTQTDLFSSEMDRERLEKLDRTLDGLKNRFGSFAVRPAALLADRGLSDLDPKTQHTIHPVGYF